MSRQCIAMSYGEVINAGRAGIPYHRHADAQGNWLSTAWGTAASCTKPRDITQGESARSRPLLSGKEVSELAGKDALNGR